MTAIVPTHLPGPYPSPRLPRPRPGPITAPNGPTEPALGDRSACHAIALGEAWRTMRRARTSIVAHVAADTGDIHLEAGDVDTLDQIARSGGLIPMSELASQLRVAPSTATKAVSRLVEQGLAIRHRDQRDRRVWRVSLTEAGACAHTTARNRRLAFACRVLERFEPEDRDAIGRLLSQLADALGQELGIPTGHRDRFDH